MDNEWQPCTVEPDEMAHYLDLQCLQIQLLLCVWPFKG